ncbi:extracellular protein [Ophiocordyceps camponoti-floridani]|uniref:Extracellular protein n=1 Tax=Ophiocordyceps camponoti-floridani TaxID=2030778 RepID=A0A8H4Q1J5_9HYPO|nr:extracellular protein [Ophiocordyceps camponoti-floridani]
MIKKLAALTTALVGFVSLSQAHMEMMRPAPLRSGYNPFTQDRDWDMRSPLESSGQDYPCKGSLDLLGTPQGQVVEEWTAGTEHNVTITGNTPHGGGSCQVSLSTDKGSSWRVLRSFVGHCPVMGESSYSFKLPADAPTGQALVGWTWFNKVGNREMYMNCAVVNIKAGGYSSSSYADRPAMFAANIGNGCGTEEGYDLEFPHMGPDPEISSRRTHPPVGKCAY